MDRGDILNIGGFSNAVFTIMAAFLTEDAGWFVAEVEAVTEYSPVCHQATYRRA